MEDTTIQPDLRILQRDYDIGPAERLVVGGIAVGGEARIDESSLVVVDEVGFLRPVGGEPVRCNGDNNGEKTFDDEDPALWAMSVPFHSPEVLR